MVAPRVVLGPKQLVVGGGVVAFSSVLLWVWWVHRHPGQLWSMIDLQVLDWGGQLVRDPAILYEARFGGVLPFFYPPFAALGFAALNVLSFSFVKALESVVVIVSVFAVTWLTLGMAARRRGEPLSCQTRLAATGVLGGGAMWVEPVQQTLAFGQLSAALLLMVIADLALDDRRWFKGALIGIATGLKLYPAVFIVYLLVTGRIRAAVVGSGWLLTTMAIGYAFLPDLSAQFWSRDGLSSLTSRIDTSDLMNQSLNGYFARVTTASEFGHQLWLVTALVVAAVGLLLVVELFRCYGELGGMLATALVSLLASPISWDHYWIWVVPALVWGAYEVWARHWWWGVIPHASVVALFFAYPARINPVTGHWDSGLVLLPKGILWMVPQADQREFGWDRWQQVLGNLYVIFGVAVLLVAVAWLVRIRFRGSVRIGGEGTPTAVRRSDPATAT